MQEDGFLTNMHIFFYAKMGVLVGLLVSCGERGLDAELPPEEVGVGQSVEVGRNEMAGLPGPIYQGMGESAIHWRPWTREALEEAGTLKRMIFAVVAMPQQSTYKEELSGLESRADVVSEINENYVPILIDGGGVREMGLLASTLSKELGTDFDKPMMIWMTPEGAPVSWMPLAAEGGEDAGGVFQRFSVVMKGMWQDEREYFLNNSEMNLALIKGKMLGELESQRTGGDLADQSAGYLRQLVSLYDPLSRSLDEAGSFFPSGVLELLAMGVQTDGLPGDLEKRSREVLSSLLDDLLRSAMFDPIEGGVYSSRQGAGWSLPNFTRDCSSQAKVAVSLLESFAATGDRRALVRALGVLEFADKNYLTADGLYSFGGGSPGEVSEWMWSFDEIRELLSPKEFPVLVIAAGLEENGNIPMEIDSERKFFRKNSLLNTKDAGEVAELLDADEEEISALLKGAMAKLLEARNERVKRVGKGNANRDANAVATLDMVSAFATAYRITGENRFRARSEELLGKAKEAFADGLRLNLYRGDAPESVIGGRAYLYALAIQAALDVYAITLSEEWKFWAGDLASTAAELFAGETFVKEAAAEMNFCDLPLTNHAMLFEESSVGLFAMARVRLSALDMPVSKALADLVSGYPSGIGSNPIPYSGVVQAGFVEGFGRQFLIGESAPEKLKEAILRLPLRAATRKISPDEPRKVFEVEDDGGVSEVTNSADIELPFLP